MIQLEHFILFLKEAEFRLNVNGLDYHKQIKELFNIMNYIKDTNMINLYSDDE